MSKITYTDKEYIYENAEIPEINKITDGNMNEIKSVVNENDTRLTTAETDKLDKASVKTTKTENNTDTYSCDYINKQLLNIDKGSVTIETSNNNYIEVAVTFNKTFNTIPTVMLTPDSVGLGFNNPNVGVKRNSITTTGFTMVYSSNYTAGLTNKVSYLAIE